MSKVATILGNKMDAQFYGEWYNMRKAYFNNTFVDPETKKTIVGVGRHKKKVIDNQSSYAVPIALGIFNDDILDAEAQNLKEAVERPTIDLLGKERSAYSLMTGFIGTFCISKALSESGLSEDAYKQILNDKYPSWLYPVKQGATTIWERLNSYTKDDGFGGNNSMNSFNHYSFGAVGSWMLNHSLGIQRDEAHPGFQSFVLAPEVDPTGKMSYAAGHYDSMYGRIESTWKVVNKEVTFDFGIPANTSATIILPESDEITIDGKPLKESNVVLVKKKTNGKIQLKVGSGHYQFKTPLTIH